MGATYDKVLFLVTDLYSIYDIRAEGTAGIAFILLKQKRHFSMIRVNSKE